MRLRYLVPFVYILFLMLPIYWLLNMSFKTTNEILGQFTLWPQLHLRQLRKNFHRPDMVLGLHQFAYLCADQYGAFGFGCTAGCLCIFALPFPGGTSICSSGFCPTEWLRRRFSRCHSFSSIGRRVVRHAHRCRARPYIVQHSLGGLDFEGFMSGVPKELDETAYVTATPSGDSS